MIGVGQRHIGFRLVVIIVGDEILDGVVGKKAPKLAIKLGCQRLVRRENERWPLRLLDDMRHGEGLARAGDAEQHLVALDLAGRPRTARLMACGWSPLARRRAMRAVARPAISPARGRYGVNTAGWALWAADAAARRAVPRCRPADPAAGHVHPRRPRDGFERLCRQFPESPGLSRMSHRPGI